MVQGVWSDDPALQLEATTQFRKLLSIGLGAAPILEVHFLFLFRWNIRVMFLTFVFSFLCRTQPSNWRGYKSRCGPSVCGVSWETWYAPIASTEYFWYLLLKWNCPLRCNQTPRLTFIFICSLKLHGLWPMLHLEHQIIHELLLNMVRSPCLCSFLALAVMMSESRLSLTTFHTFHQPESIAFGFGISKYFEWCISERLSSFNMIYKLLISFRNLTSEHGEKVFGLSEWF